MDTISIQLRREVFMRLQKLATPLVDDVSSIVERLIDHWEKDSQTTPPAAALNNAISQVWYSKRGEPLPVGLQLHKTYLGKKLVAIVTDRGIVFDGKLYDSPSAAAIAAKTLMGTSGDAASTNGWKFWEMDDPKTSKRVSIEVLRAQFAKEQVEVGNRLLAELKNL